MKWIDHSRDFPEGSHAMFSPSQYTWMNYTTEEEIFNRVHAVNAAKIGTIVHMRAKKFIDKRLKPTKKTASQIITMDLLDGGVPRVAFDEDFLAENFVNFVTDAIGFGMDPERPLVYSEWCAGTADAIIFDEKKKILRIHDLKTGVTPAKFEQLRAYAALYFLEYQQFHHAVPGETKIELRIYQGGEVLEEYPTAEDIVPIMDKIIWISSVMQQSEKG